MNNDIDYKSVVFELYKFNDFLVDNDYEINDDFIMKNINVYCFRFTNNVEIYSKESSREVLSVNNNSINMSLDDANKILEVLNIASFEQLYSSLGAEDTVIISLSLGKIRGRFFSAQEISDFLNIPISEVRESIKRVLDVYKEYLINILTKATAVVSEISKVLEKKYYGTK